MMITDFLHAFFNTVCPMKISPCRIALLALLTLLTASASLLSNASAAPPIRPNPPSMTIPDGLAVETVAAPPLLNHPVAACLDERGRLFVCENTGDNLVADELEKRPQNVVTVLTDTNRDGIYDKKQTFADGFTFPQGVLWHDGALYVASPPAIWKLEDLDDDGVADKRIAIASGFGYTGSAASVHTPHVSPNGRLFWGHGRKKSAVKNVRGETIYEGISSRIWTSRADGDDLRTHCGGGMGNPVELDFWKTGEVIGNVNFLLRDPMRSDCLVHWLHGGVYPYMPRSLTEFTSTGPLLREIYSFGHVAVAGLTRYRSGALSPSPQENWSDQFFMTLFNSQELMRIDIERDGATFKATTHPFLDIHDPDVHLAGVIEDADGSLLLIDTGGWFREGCPTSGSAKPNVKGAIYRIRKAGPWDRTTDWRGNHIAWDTASAEHLCVLLGDSRHVVRQRAAATLAARGADSVTALAETLSSHPDADVRIRAAFALGRNKAGKAAAALRTALKDKDPEVRLAATNAIGERGDKAALRGLLANLYHSSQALQRESAVSLGLIGDSKAVPDLVASLGQADLDRTREHSLIRALLDIDDPAATEKAFASKEKYYGSSPDFQRRKLIVLDRIAPNKLAPDDVLPFLTSGDKNLRQTSVELFIVRREWIPLAGGIVKQYMEKPDPDLADTVATLLVAGLKAKQELCNTQVAKLLAHANSETRDIGLDVLSKSSGLKPDPAWLPPLRKLLGDKNPVRVASALSAAKSLEPQPFVTEARALAADKSRPNLIRVQALQLFDTRGRTPGPAAFDLLESVLANPASPAGERLQACRLLAGYAEMTLEQKVRTATLMATAGPLEFPLLMESVPPHKNKNDEKIGKLLATAYVSAPGANAVPAQERKRLLVEVFSPELWRDAVAKLNQRVAEEKNITRKIDRMEAKIANGGGNIVRGKEVAHSANSTCVVCHHIVDTGNQVGPDLSHIGQIRKPRDLLESIILPSASFAQDYEAYVLETTDGRVLTGVIKGESGDAVQFTDAAGQTQTIPRSRVKSIDPLPVSLMPPGLDKVLPEQDLLDLVAYLTTLK
ncbi:MAG: HEAT repeat domain-containing protein [Pirellulales bacterium]